jgi:hypothetical protein
MNSKLLKTVFCLVALTIVGGGWKIARYYLDMYYAQVAAKQVVDDSAYTLLKSRQMATSITNILAWVLILIILYFLYRVWQPKKKEIVS